MRQLVLFAVLATALFSCSGNKNQANNSEPAVELEQLLAVAEQKVDKTVTVVGYVTHTCKHSGKKCFIVGESQNITLRVEAQGEIETFSPELVGSKLAITGVLKEQHLSRETIDEMENDVIVLQHSEEASEEDCAAELSNISDMRKWMKDNNKDYFVIYYMDGQKYDVLDLTN
jgi:hypothetical protein